MTVDEDYNYKELQEECREYLRKVKFTPGKIVNCPPIMGNIRGTMNCPDDDAIRRAEKKVFKQRLKELETTLADLDETIEQLNGLKIGDTTYYFLFEHNTEQLIFIDLYINGNGGNNPINISYGNTHIIPEKILSHPYEQFMGERYSEILNSVTRAENKMQRRFPSIHTTSGFTVTPGTAYVEGVDSNIGLLQIDDYGEHSKREYILTPTAIKIIDDENKSWKEYPLWRIGGGNE